MAQNGESDAEKVLTMTESRLANEVDLKIDYVKICNAQSLEEVDTVDHESVLLLAVSVGKTRLIDNGNLIS
jgi:pantoate--beta-alanine ligase